MSLLIDLPDLGVKLKLNAGELNVTVPNPDRKDEYKLTGNLKISKVVTSGLSMTGMSVQDLTLSDLRFDEKNIADLVLAYTGRELTLKSCVYQGRSEFAIFNHEMLQKLLIIDCDLHIIIGEHAGVEHVDVVNTVNTVVTDVYGGYGRKNVCFSHHSEITLRKKINLMVVVNSPMTGKDDRPHPRNDNASQFPIDHVIMRRSEIPDRSSMNANLFAFSWYSTSQSDYSNGSMRVNANVSAPTGLFIGTTAENVIIGKDQFYTPRIHNRDHNHHVTTTFISSFAWYQRMICTETLDIPAICRMIGLTPEVAEIVNRLSA